MCVYIYIYIYLCICLPCIHLQDLSPGGLCGSSVCQQDILPKVWGSEAWHSRPKSHSCRPCGMSPGAYFNTAWRLVGTIYAFTSKCSLLWLTLSFFHVRACTQVGCGAIQFAKRQSCRNCGAAKPVSQNEKHAAISPSAENSKGLSFSSKAKPGDWTCEFTTSPTCLQI